MNHSGLLSSIPGVKRGLLVIQHGDGVFDANRRAQVKLSKKGVLGQHMVICSAEPSPYLLGRIKDGLLGPTTEVLVERASI